LDDVEGAVLKIAPGGAARLLGAMPASALDLLQRTRFQRTLRLAARKSPFYRDEFRRRGIQVDRIRTPADLGDFFTTGEDLRKHGPDAFLIGRADTAFETTGTTSPEPKRVYFGANEIRRLASASSAALHLLGVTRDDVVLSAFDCSFWVSPVVARTALQNIGCFHVEAGKIDPLECYVRGSHYKPTIIFGEPSWLVRFSEIAEQRGPWPVKLIIVGGENMAERNRRDAEAVWHAPVHVSYGQTEAFGSLGLECSEHHGYHRNDLHFHFEVVNQNEDGLGELVYTTLTRDVMPLIRYRSSDATRLVDEPCRCGLFTGRIAKIVGRIDEMVVCGMGNVGPWVFEDLLRNINGVGPDWQATLIHNGRRDEINLVVESADSESETAIRTGVFDALRQKFPDFWKNHEMRLFDFTVSIVSSGTLRTGRKVRRIVDRRAYGREVLTGSLDERLAP
jgi:phenylacetate-CoA ligase